MASRSSGSDENLSEIDGAQSEKGEDEFLSKKIELNRASTSTITKKCVTNLCEAFSIKNTTYSSSDGSCDDIALNANNPRREQRRCSLKDIFESHEIENSSNVTRYRSYSSQDLFSIRSKEPKSESVESFTLHDSPTKIEDEISQNINPTIMETNKKIPSVDQSINTNNPNVKIPSMILHPPSKGNSLPNLPASQNTSSPIYFNYSPSAILANQNKTPDGLNLGSTENSKTLDGRLDEAMELLKTNIKFICSSGDIGKYRSQIEKLERKEAKAERINRLLKEDTSSKGKLVYTNSGIIFQEHSKS